MNDRVEALKTVVAEELGLKRSSREVEQLANDIIKLQGTIFLGSKMIMESKSNNGTKYVAFDRACAQLVQLGRKKK